MDLCDDDDDDDDVRIPSPKSKPKKKSLCRLLMQKKTRVGCLSSESEDISLHNRSPVNGPIKQYEKDNVSSPISPLFKVSCSLECDKEKTRGSKDIERSESPREHNNSTKLSLCCAMTESSRSSSHHHSSEYQRRVAEVPNSKNNNRGKLSTVLADIETQSRKSLTISKASSLDGKLIPDPLVQETNCDKVCGDNEDEINTKQGNGISVGPSPTQSDVSSCDSSPLPTSYSQSHFRKRLLSQRRSADNLLVSSCPSPSLRHSSPISSRSAPEPHRYKTRSASHDTVLPPKEKSGITAAGSESTIGSSMAVTRGRGFVASMDSLARHSLLAAQVLHLIPTIKARERNFLHGRIAANSLLGSLELERTLPHRELRIFVGTWNMNGQAPPQELNDFMLPSSLEHVPDVIAVGTQESYSERFEWEVCIQETLGPSHLMLHSAVLGTLHLAVFIRRDLLWFCSVPEEASFSVRPGTAFRTKGAVAIAFMLFGTSYLFITSHLTAHMEKVKERVQDVRRIMRSLDLPKILPVRHKSKDVTQNFDYVFWCGDLNFRLSQPREEVMQWVLEQEFPLPLPHSLHSDQLRTTIAEGSVFRDFEEGPITFPPTYKYDPGTQKFDTSHKQRTPAYTDRILYKCRGRGSSSGVLECLLYSSVPSICTSDHKPVWGLYSSAVRPGIDTIPLAAGLFNREVYLEGIKRRAAAMDKSQGTSAVCTVQ